MKIAHGTVREGRSFASSSRSSVAGRATWARGAMAPVHGVCATRNERRRLSGRKRPGQSRDRPTDGQQCGLGQADGWCAIDPCPRGLNVWGLSAAMEPAKKPVDSSYGAVVVVVVVHRSIMAGCGRKLAIHSPALPCGMCAASTSVDHTRARVSPVPPPRHPLGDEKAPRRRRRHRRLDRSHLGLHGARKTATPTGLDQKESSTVALFVCRSALVFC